MVEAFHQGSKSGQNENEAGYEFEKSSRHCIKNSCDGPDAANIPGMSQELRIAEKSDRIRKLAESPKGGNGAYA